VVQQGRAQYLVFADNASGIQGRRLTGEINRGIPDPSVRVRQINTSFDEVMGSRVVLAQIGYFIPVPPGSYIFTIRLQETGAGCRRRTSSIST
jgi:hypothetical protein